MFLGLSTAGISNFGIVALMVGFGTSFPVANIALTALLAAGAVGVLAGGSWPCWIMDQNLPRWVFGVSAVLMMFTIALTLFAERQQKAGYDATRCAGV